MNPSFPLGYSKVSTKDVGSKTSGSIQNISPRVITCSEFRWQGNRASPPPCKILSQCSCLLHHRSFWRIIRCYNNTCHNWSWFLQPWQSNYFQPQWSFFNFLTSSWLKLGVYCPFCETLSPLQVLKRGVPFRKCDCLELLKKPKLPVIGR